MVQRDSLMEEEEEEEENNTTTIFPSPLSGDDDSVLLQPHHDQPSSPNKRRISRRKKVVTYPIGDGLRTRGSDVYPPPDSWSWRKYGQKPIKGSPYPRGYYRCSTSKGCPAKKQVERSRHDPTTLLITYSCDHNHSTTRTSHHQPDPPASSTPVANFSSEECAAFANQTEIEPATSSTFVELAGELGWLCEVDSTMMNKTTFITPVWTHAEVEVVMPIGEEDKLLFGDLGDLPESAVVFRHSEFL